jgi:uncharacterized SAM-binding protein YcdF (DUF218 family)
MKRGLRRNSLRLVVGTLGIILVGALASDWPARWLVVEDPTGPADAVIVLAGDPDYERTTTAVSLVRSGQVRLLILTGGEPGPGDSAASLRETAIALGVPPERIRLEEVSRSTREEFVAMNPILRSEGIHSVIVVTSPYHQRRAFLTARKALTGIEVRNRPAAPSSWSPRHWWRDSRSRRIVATEYAKLAYYAWRGWL